MISFMVNTFVTPEFGVSLLVVLGFCAFGALFDRMQEEE